jgi:putative endonuclease
MAGKIVSSLSSSAVPAKAGTHRAARSDVFRLSPASQPYGTLYVGSTSDLVRRVWEHKVKAVPGFTAKYGVDRLVWFECHDGLETAMEREKRIKEWKREWKIQLIEKDNPHWVDLYRDLAS